MFDVKAPLDAVTLPPGFIEVAGITPASLELIVTFQEMLVTENAHTNLIGRSTIPEFWVRHFIDSAQLRWFAPKALVWADLGSGAGLPGIVLAILLKGVLGSKVHLVESRIKRCRFLSDVVGRLSLPAEVHHARAEDLELSVEIVTARACAPLDRLLTFAAPYFERGARGLFLKGSAVEEEIARAQGLWRFQYSNKASLSDERGCILDIQEVTSTRAR